MELQGNVIMNSEYANIRKQSSWKRHLIWGPDIMYGDQSLTNIKLSLRIFSVVKCKTTKWRLRELCI
jgi:hypothetical protein